jgi:hypothetical protein
MQRKEKGYPVTIKHWGVGYGYPVTHIGPTMQVR